MPKEKNKYVPWMFEGPSPTILDVDLPTAQEGELKTDNTVRPDQIVPDKPLDKKGSLRQPKINRYRDSRKKTWR